MTAKELTDEHRVALASAFLFELGLTLARENPDTVNNIPMQALARTWLAAFHGGPDHAIAIWNICAPSTTPASTSCARARTDGHRHRGTPARDRTPPGKRRVLGISFSLSRQGRAIGKWARESLVVPPGHASSGRAFSLPGLRGFLPR